MTTLTVTVAASTSTARVGVSALTGTAPWTLYRVDPTGARHLVTGARAFTTAIVVVDAEVPLGQPVHWVVVDAAGVQTSSATVTVAAPTSPGMGGRPCPVLSNPVTGDSVPVVLCQDGMTLQYDSRAQVVEIESSGPGPIEPVVLWDGEGSARFAPQVITETSDALAALNSALATGDRLLLRSPCPGVADVWFQRVGQRSTARLVKRALDETRHTDLGQSVVLSGPYDPNRAAAGDTLGDVHAAVATVGTLRAIADTWATLGDIALADLGAV